MGKKPCDFLLWPGDHNEKSKTTEQLKENRGYYMGKSIELGRFLFRSVKPPYMDEDDFIQECRQAYEIAANKYRSELNTSFHSYWETIARNRVKKLMAEEYRHHPTFVISLDETIGDDDDTTYSDIIGRNDNDIYDRIQQKEVMYQVREAESSLSDEERKVVIKRMGEQTFEEIAKDMNCSVRHVKYLNKTAKEKLANNKYFK